MTPHLQNQRLRENAGALTSFGPLKQIEAGAQEAPQDFADAVIDMLKGDFV